MNASNIQTNNFIQGEPFIQTENLALTQWAWIDQSSEANAQSESISSLHHSPFQRDWLKPLRQWLDQIEIKNARLARSICRFIPAQCPFERDIKVFGRILFHIPPMCKLNPVYEEVVALRFRALCYLADVCGEDISPYC
jgi:hypothetical protein